MKTILFCALLAGSLGAEESNWKIVKASVQEGSSPGTGTWTFVLRNVSGQALEVGEDWRTAGKASANLAWPDSFFGLFSEPCHGPKNFLTVEPGATVEAVVPRMTGLPRVAGKAPSLTIAERSKHLAEVAPLTEIKIEGEKDATAEAPPASVQPSSGKNPEK